MKRLITRINDQIMSNMLLKERSSDPPLTLAVCSSGFGLYSLSLPLVHDCPAALSAGAAWPVCGWTPCCWLWHEPPPAACSGTAEPGKKIKYKSRCIMMRHWRLLQRGWRISWAAQALWQEQHTDVLGLFLQFAGAGEQVAGCPSAGTAQSSEKLLPVPSAEWSSCFSPHWAEPQPEPPGASVLQTHYSAHQLYPAGGTQILRYQQDHERLVVKIEKSVHLFQFFNCSVTDTKAVDAS